MARNPDWTDQAYGYYNQSSQLPPNPDQNLSAPAAPKSGGGSPSKSKPSGGGGSPAASPNLSIDAATLAQQYGFTLAFLKAYPELNALFNQAVAGGWSADRFTAGLKSTNWYQNFSDSQRKALVLQATDPASYNQQLNSDLVHVRDLAAQMGVDPNDGSMITIATKYLQGGWNDEQARAELGLHLNFNSAGMIGGEAGKELDTLNQYMYQMGVKNSDDWVRQNVISIVSGKGSEDDAKNQIMQQAMAAFPQYADQIKGGMTVESLAQPYMQSMNQILEIPAGQINLFDPTIKNAMSYKDPAGTGSALPLWQFQNQLREDPRWSATKNAQDAAMGTAHKVLQDFGIYS